MKIHMISAVTVNSLSLQYPTRDVKFGAMICKGKNGRSMKGIAKQQKPIRTFFFVKEKYEDRLNSIRHEWQKNDLSKEIYIYVCILRFKWICLSWYATVVAFILVFVVHVKRKRKWNHNAKTPTSMWIYISKFVYFTRLSEFCHTFVFSMLVCAHVCFCYLANK